jgi:hypothetical protein
MTQNFRGSGVLVFALFVFFGFGVVRVFLYVY